MALSNEEKRERLDWLSGVIREAGALILNYYDKKIEVDWKSPGDPVTGADRASNEFLIECMRKNFPDDAVLSEESNENGRRFEREHTWIIDPLDGTKEFISRNGEFAVMIGLTENGKPILGAVYQPTEDRLYYGASGIGAYMDHGGSVTELRVSSRSELPALKLVVSRSHLEPVVDDLRLLLGIEELRQSGSVGIKCGLIARGECDLYLHPSQHTKLWDSCAPQAILAAAGGVLTDMNGELLNYLDPEVINMNGMLASNGKAHQQIVSLIRKTLAVPE